MQSTVWASPENMSNVKNKKNLITVANISKKTTTNPKKSPAKPPKQSQPARASKRSTLSFNDKRDI